jgi:hypothetical protein
MSSWATITVYASFGFRRELYRLPQLVGKKIYWGGWYEAGSAFNDPEY